MNRCYRLIQSWKNDVWGAILPPHLHQPTCRGVTEIMTPFQQHQIRIPSVGISKTETPHRSDRSFQHKHRQIYFPAHGIISNIPLFSSLRKALRNPVFMRLSRLKCAFFIHHFAHFYKSTCFIFLLKRI